MAYEKQCDKPVQVHVLTKIFDLTTLGPWSMSKRKKSAPQLYDHNATSTVHRNIGISADGRRIRATTNFVNVSSVQASTTPYTPDEGRHESIPYAFDDEHIPIDTRNADVISGVNVKVCERAKRYQNTVRIFFCRIMSQAIDHS